MTKLRILTLDIEGGHGGSSRSLIETLSHIDHDLCEVKVICKRGGSIEQAYKRLNIDWIHEPTMPTLTSLARPSRNLVSLLHFWGRVWPRSGAFRQRLLRQLESINVLHLNHISLTNLARWISKRRPDMTIVMHVRTMPVRSFFSDRQAKIAASCCTSFIYITENERDHFERMIGKGISGQVIYNSVSIPDMPPPKHERVPDDTRLKLACISNFSLERGIDRLLDIAEAMSDAERSSVLFVVAGEMKLPRRFNPKSREFSGKDSTLEDIAKERGLDECFLFLGHTDRPESVLSVCHVLLKPTRENNPWGRDILEGLAYGLPVYSIGIYNSFVKNSVTGYLQSVFNPRKAADWIISLHRDPEIRQTLGRQASDLVAALCNPDKLSFQFLKHLTDAASRHMSCETKDQRIRVNAFLPAFNSGGAERVLLSLAGGLPQDSFETRLFCLDCSNEIPYETRSISMFHDLNCIRLRHAVLKIVGAMRIWKCDVVVSSQAHLNIALLLLSSFFKGARCIVREANMPSACLASGHWPAWYKVVYSVALTRCAALIASSNMMALDFTSNLGVPANKIHVIYNPVDISSIREQAFPCKRLQGPGRRFVAAGRLVRQKGFDALIPLMRYLDQKDHLTIFGDGPEYDTLSRIIDQLHLNNQVTLAGFTPNLAPYLAGADSVILSSRWEGMPNIALEALTVGTPLIATRSSGAIEEIAQLATRNSVFLANDATELLALMKSTEASCKEQLYPSLLPAAFSQTHADEKFSRLVKSLAFEDAGASIPGQS